MKPGGARLVHRANRTWTTARVDGCDCSWANGAHCHPSGKGNDGTRCWKNCCQPTAVQLLMAAAAKPRAWAAADWKKALARLPLARKAGLIHMQIGPWPRWTSFLLQSAAANEASLNYYFLGSSELRLQRCANCAWLPLSVEWLQSRVRDRLNVSLRVRGGSLHARKLCDLKPMWPALLPELVARHRWIGYADLDILFGNLTDEVDRLRPEDDLLVPQSFYPQPLANGNMLLMRSVPRLTQAFRRSSTWQEAVSRGGYLAFDEWGHASTGWGQVTMVKVYLDMLLEGGLVARPTARFFVQDAVVQQGRAFPTLQSHGAHVSVTWRNGVLVVSREGVCVCPQDVVPQFVLSTCPACLFSKGAAVVHSSSASRRVEAMGIHFQEWKKSKPFRRTTATTCSTYAHGFALEPKGFRCVEQPSAGRGGWRGPRGSRMGG